MARSLLVPAFDKDKKYEPQGQATRTCQKSREACSFDSVPVAHAVMLLSHAHVPLPVANKRSTLGIVAFSVTIILAPSSVCRTYVASAVDMPPEAATLAKPK